jgi:hypothetical protein
MTDQLRSTVGGQEEKTPGRVAFLHEKRKQEELIKAAEAALKDSQPEDNRAQEDIFKPYLAIEEAYQQLEAAYQKWFGLEAQEPKPWLEERRQKLREQAELRRQVAAQAEQELRYEAALQQYQSLLDLQKTVYENLGQELNLNLKEKIAALQIKANYDRKYKRIEAVGEQWPKSETIGVSQPRKSRIEKFPLFSVLLVAIVAILSLIVLPCIVLILLWSAPSFTAVLRLPTQTPTPTASATVMISLVSLPRSTLAPTQPPLPPPAPTETPIEETLPPIFTPTSTSLPTPTSVLTPTPTPTPLVALITGQIYLRKGPGREYGRAGYVSPGDEVVVLGRAANGFGLKIRTVKGLEGWITALNYIQLPLDLESIPIIPGSTLSPGQTSQLTLRGSSVSGKIAAGSYREFQFQETQDETVMVLMFEPNVNLNKGLKVEFRLYYINQTGETKVVGAGSHPGVDLDGNLESGELLWRGGPLVPNSPYYLRITNNSPTAIVYCLATQELLYWSCR